MKARFLEVAKLVKRYDPRLFIIKSSDGVIKVYRRTQDRAYWDDETLLDTHVPCTFVLALTHDWTLQGRPTDWGLEPLWQRLLEMDGWRNDRIGEEMRLERNRAAEIRERSTRNTIRAKAYDLRSEFAKATNEINTSTMEKTDYRRIRDEQLNRN